MTPTYLHDLLPTLNRDINRYELRNNNDYTLPNYRLANTRSSYIPNTVRLWNDLPQETRDLPSLTQFRNAVTPKQQKPPVFYNVGTRRLNILHTKLRYSCSALNHDLHRVNLVESPAYSCGHHSENVFHYFFECPIYTTFRENMLSHLRPYNPVNLEMLLCGKQELSVIENENIFNIVQTYIHASNRF